MASLPAQFNDALDAAAWYAEVSERLSQLGYDHELGRPIGRFMRYSPLSREDAYAEAQGRYKRKGKPGRLDLPSSGRLPDIAVPEQGWASLHPDETFNLARVAFRLGRAALKANRAANDRSATASARREALSAVTRLNETLALVEEGIRLSSRAWLPVLATSTASAATPAPPPIPVTLR